MTDALTDRARTHLPLSDAVFHLMLSLADGPAHGYGILLEVEERSDGAVRMGTGTLYSAVKRLRDQGLIEDVAPPASEGDSAGGDSRRRYYALTPLGRIVLREEARRLEALVLFARRKSVLDFGDPV
jgi:DNA-binding PadR family transcriptional regulator